MVSDEQPTQLVTDDAATGTPASPPETTPTRVGRYVILHTIGRGGFGTVFAAWDPELERRVALKLLEVDKHRLLAEGADLRERLLAEARALAQLNHRNVVAVYDVGTYLAPGRTTDDASVFIVMEYVEGTTLRAWARTHHQWREVLDMVIRAGEGLAAAHRRDCAHLDFKPSNVVIGGDGVPQVLDFGLARFVRRSREFSSNDAIISSIEEPVRGGRKIHGTPSYMAPEQLAGADVDQRADQWAFCAVSWELLYGAPPYTAVSLAKLRALKVAGELQPPRSTNGVPKWVHEVLVRGLEPAPGARFSSMDDLLAALRADPSVRRRRIAGIGIGVLALGGTAVGVVSASTARARVCEHPEAELAGTWDDEVRQGLRTSFIEADPLGEERFERFAHHVDAHVEAWSTAWSDACRAQLPRASVTPEARAAAIEQSACLDGQRRALSGMVASLTDLDRTLVTRAIVAASRLGPVSTCSPRRDEGLAKSADPSTLADIDEAVARIDVQLELGRYEAALEGCERVLEMAEHSGDALGLARAELAFARFHAANHRPRQVTDHARRALSHASSARALRERVLALASLASAESSLANPGGAKAYLDTARAFAFPRFESTEMEDDLDYRAATLAKDRDDYAAGKKILDDLISRLETRTDVQPVMLANAYTLRGSIKARDGSSFTEAIDDYDRALKLLQDALGETHPRVATVTGNRSNTLFMLGQLAEAEAGYRRAIELSRAANGDDASAVASFTHNLALVASERGRFTTARELLQRARGLLRGVLPAEHPWFANSLSVSSRVASKLGRHEEALALIEESLAMTPKTDDDASAFESRLAQRSTRHLALAQVEEARRDLTAAAQVFERPDGSTKVGFEDYAVAKMEFAIHEQDWDDAQRWLDVILRGRASQQTNRDNPLMPLWDLPQARILVGRGEHQAAADLAANARVALAENLGSDAPILIAFRHQEARALTALGRTEEATAAWRDVAGGAAATDGDPGVEVDALTALLDLADPVERAALAERRSIAERRATAARSARGASDFE